MKRTLRLALIAALALGHAGCSALTEPKPLIDEFNWEVLDSPAGITEGVEFAPFFGDISFAGQLKTPTPCHTISSKLENSGSTITIRVNAASTNSATCAQAQAAFRYTGIIRNLRSGTFTMRVIHAIPGQADQEYTKTVKL
jgi:hypothetical protein